MKILYARNADFDFPEANKVQVANMCRAFNENECEITLIAFGKNIQEIEKRYKLDKIKTRFLKRKIRFFILGDIILFLFFLIHHAKEKNIYTRDIVFASLIKTFFRKKTVFFETHSIPKKIWWKYIFKKFIPKFDRTIVISQGLKEKLAEIGVKTDNALILHDAVDLKEFNIDMSQEEARKKLMLPENKIIITYVGNTGKDRDLTTFIETAKKMKNLFFVIFGKKENYLEKASESMPNFIFKGYIDNPALAYKASDILFAGYSRQVKTIDVMSPLKIFEYLATNRPSIVADFPRTREVLSEKEVYFYKSSNPIDLERVIRNVSEDQDQANTKALASLEKAKKFTWKRRTQKIIHCYREEE